MNVGKEGKTCSSSSPRLVFLLSYHRRYWNLPVHNFVVRHVYFPVLRAGYGKMTANVAVFAVSAFFHELLISVGRVGRQVVELVKKERYTHAHAQAPIINQTTLIFPSPYHLSLYVGPMSCHSFMGFLSNDGSDPFNLCHGSIGKDVIQGNTSGEFCLLVGRLG